MSRLRSRVLPVVSLAGWMTACGGSGPVDPSKLTSTTTSVTTTSTSAPTTTTAPGGTTSTSAPTSTTTAASTSTAPASTTTTSAPGTTSTTTSAASTTTTSIIIIITTSTTSTAVVSFSTVYSQMNTCLNAACHPSHGGPTHFSNQAEAYDFAIDRSVPNNPGGSLFLQKPSGAVPHAGSNPWPSGSAGYNAAVAWINGGRGARNERPEPDLWAAHGAGDVRPSIATGFLNSNPLRIR